MQKKRIQKALVMLLAVVMILGMQPATVHAVDLAEEPTNEQQASTTAEPEDKETALPENEPDAEATTEESTAEPEDKETALPENEPGAEASAEAPAETIAAQESTEETAAEQPMSFQGRSDSGVRVTAKAPACRATHELSGTLRLRCPCDGQGACRSLWHAGDDDSL